MAEKRRYADRRDYLIAAIRKRRKKVKQMAIEYKGGKCSQCGYNRCVDALDFHHLDSSQKDFGIGYKGYTRSWEAVKKEIDKCILVCANCHREIHSGLQLSRVSGIEKLGEFRETPAPRGEVTMSQAPINIGEGAETRAKARTHPDHRSGWGSVQQPAPVVG